MKLTGKQRRYLRGLGVELKPTVFVGTAGITERLLQALREAHYNAELVKVRIERSCPVDRKTVAGMLAESTSSHMVQVLGRTILLYRPDEEHPVLQLPTCTEQ